MTELPCINGNGPGEGADVVLHAQDSAIVHHILHYACHQPVPAITASQYSANRTLLKIITARLYGAVIAGPEVSKAEASKSTVVLAGHTKTLLRLLGFWIHLQLYSLSRPIVPGQIFVS